MSYARPRFAWLHVLADAAVGGGSIDLSAAAHADYPAERLWDYRPNRLMRFNAAATSFWVEVDRGAAGLEAVDRLVIPAGHNLGATTLEVFESTTGAFGGEEVSLGSVAAPGADVIDLALDSSSARYLRLVVTGSSLVYEFGELYLTRQRQPASRGFDPGYSDLPVAQTVEEDTPSGIVAVAFGPPRDQIEAEINRLDGADLTLFDELKAHALRRLGVWYWRHDTASVPIFATPTVTKREQARENPTLDGEAWQFGFTLREVK